MCWDGHSDSAGAVWSDATVARDRVMGRDGEVDLTEGVQLMIVRLPLMYGTVSSE